MDRFYSICATVAQVLGHAIYCEQIMAHKPDDDENYGRYPTPRDRVRFRMRPPVTVRNDYETLVDRRLDIPIPRAFLSNLNQFRGPTAKVMLYIFMYSYGMGTPSRFLSLDEIHCGAARRNGIMIGDKGRPHESDAREDPGVGLHLTTIVHSLVQLEEQHAVIARVFPVGDDETVWGVNQEIFEPLHKLAYRD